MMLETGNLKFGGDVASTQNNFAGLGATGKHVPGESFPDIETGVKAHLQHLLLYAGEHLDNPVAERTRKVQEWGVLTDWQKTLKGPVDYAQLAKQWAPTSRRYARDIAGLADTFYGSPCKGADPHPELLALAKPELATAKSKTPVKVAAATEETAADVSSDAPAAKLSGADLARRAVDEARRSGSFVRSSLGAESLLPAQNAPAVAVGEPAPADKAPAAVKIINAALPEAEVPANASAEADTRGPADAAPVEPPKKSLGKKIQTAALGAGTKSVDFVRHNVEVVDHAAFGSKADVQGLDGELRRRPFGHHQSARRSAGQLYGSRRQRRLGKARSGGLHLRLCQGRQDRRRVRKPIAGSR